ncbi:unnamed protein product [Ceutorhynchus assimilis]|uniref:Rhabdoid tumor deletion region protein 1 n=1 Tax=Ceutorhynchus assimilis TaxID=467358 RepID=A0A9N9MRA9_9CUCU|nr:unnamed protein product [Ceutorhynchus assimilis]
MYSCHKNSYLQGNFKEINAGLLNRCVQRAWTDFVNIDEHDLDPAFNRLSSAHPNIPVQNVDVTKRPEGFGKWAMPKLRRDLHNKDPTIVTAALASISDLVHDPERCYEAIKLKILDRMVDLIYHETSSVREKTAHALKSIAGVAEGKVAIVENDSLMNNLLDRVEDQFTEIRLQTAACIEMIARYWKTADVLVECGFIQVLLNNLDDVCKIVEIHLETLNSLFYCDGKQLAIEEDGFEALHRLLERDEGKIMSLACMCLAKLCSIKEGRKMAKQMNILPQLNVLLNDERVEVHTAAAQAIMFCTIISSEKNRASQIKGLPKRLAQLCKNKLRPNCQMYAIKALTCICEHPLIRKEVSQHYYHEVVNIQLNESIPEMRLYKNSLMSMLHWLPHTNE